MLEFCLLMWVCANPPAGVDPELRAASAAMEAGRYFEVLPHLVTARNHDLPRNQRVLSYELEALTQAAFGRTRESTEAFRWALGLDPGYQAPSAAGPKVRANLAAARRLGPKLLPLLPVLSPRAGGPLLHPGLTPTLGEERTDLAAGVPLYRRWWFWTGVGLVAAGASTATFLALQRHIPASTLGNQVLR